MKLVHSEDIGAPADFVFAQITDFDALTRQAIRRGARIERLDRLEAPGVGMSWKANFNYRGRDREMTSEVTEFDRPGGFVVASQVGGLDSVVVVELVTLSPSQTRLVVAVEIAATTMTARLLLQSLKLARGTLTARMSARLARFGNEIETSFRDARSG